MRSVPSTLSIPATSFKLEFFTAIARRRGHIILLCELWGLVPQIRGVASRYANEGFDVYVPELIPGTIEPSDEREVVLQRYRQANDRISVEKIAQTLAVVRAQGQAGPILVVGYCYGGRMAYHAAARLPFDAAIVFYGSLTPTPTDHPLDPWESVRQIEIPIQGHFGSADPGIPVEDVERLRHTLRRGQIFIYPDAGHAFMNEMRPTYQPDTVRLAWGRVLDFLREIETNYRLTRRAEPQLGWQTEAEQ